MRRGFISSRCPSIIVSLPGVVLWHDYGGSNRLLDEQAAPSAPLDRAVVGKQPKILSNPEVQMHEEALANGLSDGSKVRRLLFKTGSK